MPDFSFFNPSDPAFIRDPYPMYDRLREIAPLFWHEQSGLWWITTYADLTALMRERRLGRQIDHLVDPTLPGIRPRDPAYAAFHMLSDNSMFDKEPPDHTRIKKLVHKVFTPIRVESLRDEIEGIAARLISRAAAEGEFDLLADYAVPLPVEVIAALLGVPRSDRGRLRPWSAAIVRMYELGHSPETAEAATKAAGEFTAYLRALSRQRRTDPRDDLISALAAAEDEGETLTEDELIATCILLLNAGHEATVNGFGNGMRMLFAHPDQLDGLKADSTLIPGAVEEMLRYDTPLQMFRRWVLEDFTYKDCDFKLGQEIAFMFGAANRDPAVFPDPHRFDITRDPNPHITFGMGIHYCLGAPLARLELQTALRVLLTHRPDLTLIEEPAFGGGYVIRGLVSMRVRG